jgi:hypothetical protein
VSEIGRQAALLNWTRPEYRIVHAIAMRKYYDDPYLAALKRSLPFPCGHDRGKLNVVDTSQGTMRCRVCANRYSREWQRRKRAREVSK